MEVTSSDIEKDGKLKEASLGFILWFAKQIQED